MFQQLQRRSVVAGVCFVALLAGRRSDAQRQMEYLGRGVVAICVANGEVFVQWRLGADPPNIAFNVYRATDDTKPVRLNTKPIDGPTYFVDRGVDTDKRNAWFVRTVIDGTETVPSGQFIIPAGSKVLPYLSIPVSPPGGYQPNDASVGDLDGDGEYEIVVHMVGRGRDNSQDGFTTEPVFDAYRLDGTRLWRINLGKNIREGAHYTQFMVHDLDGDGRAEFACKTADGTIDGQAKVIGDAKADYRNDAGRILEGPEFLTIFDGRTGAALATANYVPPRGDVASWGDDRGNRSDRFLACVAYLDGKRPSLVMCRGYYTRCVLAAWNWRGGKLTHVWTFDSNDGTPGNDAYRGQGNHGISVGDVDGDGRDEIVYGSCVIDDDGRGLYSTGYGHGDTMHFTDIDPHHPGLEVFKANGDTPKPAGMQLRDARTGQQIFGVPSKQSGGMGRAVALDVDPRHDGLEMWGYDTRKRARWGWWRAAQSRPDDVQRPPIGRQAERSRNRDLSEFTADRAGATGLYDVHGHRISASMPATCNMGIWWDGDLLRELLNGVRISKWDFEKEREIELFDGHTFGCESNNGSKSNPCLCADILGDWREEIIARSSDNKELRIFVNTFPTEHRLYTLMHDPVYRLAVAWQNVAYNQPAHPEFFLGHGMANPPKPNIVVKEPSELIHHN